MASLPKEKRALRIVAIVIAVGGFAIALIAAVATANDEPRPRITAKLSPDRGTLTATVSASNLETQDRLAIVVDGLRRNDSPVEAGEFTTIGRIYRAYVGPDNDGNVTESVETPLPAKLITDVGIKAFTGTDSPACDDLSDKQVEANKHLGSGTACVIISIDKKIGTHPGLG
jgi:hypothetical protein